MTIDEFAEYSLSAEDEEIVRALSKNDIAEIDEWLLACINDRWQKIAKVVAKAINISEEKGELLNVPDVFFGMRIEQFEKKRIIQSRGNLKQMRFSEVKLANK